MKRNSSSAESNMYDHYLHEIRTWKRVLEFMMEENSYLKNRLADVLRAAADDLELLEAAETYLTRFIKEDEAIRFLRKDVEDQLLRLLQGKSSLTFEENYITNQQHRLRQEVESAETDFNSMLFEFNNFLAVRVER